MKKLPIRIALLIAMSAISVIFYNSGKPVHQIDQQKWTAAEIPEIDEQQIEVSIMLNGANAPLDQIAVSQLPEDRSVVPVVIDLPGCAHATTKDYIPRHIAVLTAGERTAEGRWARREACLVGNGKALKKIIQNELAIMLHLIESTPWLDERRIIIRGYGESAPIIAAYSGPSVGRIITSEPCLIDWGAISNASPLTVLLAAPASGVTSDHTTTPAYTCSAKKRPRFDPSVRVMIAEGRITPATRPVALAEAEETALAIALGLKQPSKWLWAW